MPRRAATCFSLSALEQAREGLAETRGELLGTRLGRADQRPADQRSQLGVEEIQEALFAWREVPLAGGPMHVDDADPAAARGLVNGHHSMTHIARPQIVVDDR